MRYIIISIWHRTLVSGGRIQMIENHFYYYVDTTFGICSAMHNFLLIMIFFNHKRSYRFRIKYE